MPVRSAALVTINLGVRPISVDQRVRAENGVLSVVTAMVASDASRVPRLYPGPNLNFVFVAADRCRRRILEHGRATRRQQDRTNQDNGFGQEIILRN